MENGHLMGLIMVAAGFLAISFFIGRMVGSYYSKKKYLGKIEWIRDSSLQKNVNYMICGRVNLHSNLFVIILEKSSYERFCVCGPDFDLPDPSCRFVKLDDTGCKLIAVNYENRKLKSNIAPSGDLSIPDEVYIEKP